MFASAKATDNLSAVTTSAAVSITVTSTGSGVNCTGVATYQPYPKIYNNGDLVVYNGMLYQSLSDALYNVTPGTADWWWKPLGACGTGLTTSREAITGKTTSESVPDATMFKIYPNPVQDELQILTNGESLFGCLIRIYDVTGREVFTGKPVSNRINVSKLAPGIYTLVLTTQGKLITKRFVK